MQCPLKEAHQHISQRYDDELAAVKSQLFEMGGIVEKQVTDAIKALLEVDSELAERVVVDDARINDYGSGQWTKIAV